MRGMITVLVMVVLVNLTSCALYRGIKADREAAAKAPPAAQTQTETQAQTQAQTQTQTETPVATTESKK